MKEKKKSEFPDERHTPCVYPISDPPLDSFEMINKYGTYNIQPTAEGAWAYPAIAQGLSEQAQEGVAQEREAWMEEQNARREE